MNADIVENTTEVTKKQTDMNEAKHAEMLNSKQEFFDSSFKCIG